MPNEFRKVVESVVSSKLGELTNPVQGYIPKGEIDHITWSAKKLRIPNPKGGIHPSKRPDSGYLEYTDVPLPKNQRGVIEAIASLVKDGDRAVTVAFKGGNIAFPVIINLLSILHSQEDRPVENTVDRSNVVLNSFSTAAVGAVLTTTKVIPPPVANTAAEMIVQVSQPALQAANETLKQIQDKTAGIFDYLFKPRYNSTTTKKK